VSAPTASSLLDPFRFLLGSWSGKGVGVWRPDSPFRYREELLLEVVPDRDLIHLQQRTFDAETGPLRHSEQGFLRLFPAGEAELVVAVPAGYTEIHQGRVEGTILRLELVTLAVSPRARPLDRTQRRLEFRAGQLHHAVGIAVGSGEVVAHVASSLERIQGPGAP